MKKTQIKELLSNIKATFMSFMAIVLFVVLSVGVFTGISWTSPALRNSAEEIFDEGNLCDIEIQFPNGLTDEDLQQIMALDGVDEIATGYSSLQMMKRNGKEYVTKVMSLTDNINVPVQKDGRLPRNEGEIALNKSWAKDQGIKVGDTVTFKHDGSAGDKDGMKYLTEDTYLVTALVESPAYISYSLSSYGFANIGSGYIQCLAFTAPQSFDTSAYPGYTQAFIRSDMLRSSSTSDGEYMRLSQKLKDHISALGDNLARERYGMIWEEANGKLEEGYEKLSEAEAKIKDAEKKIKEGKKTLAEGEAEYAAQEKKLARGLSQLQAGQQQYNTAKSNYEKASATYEDIKKSRSQLKEEDLTYKEITEMNRQLDSFSKDANMKDLGSDNVVQLQGTLDEITEKFDEETWEEDTELTSAYRRQVLSDMDEAISQGGKELASAKKELEKSDKKLEEGRNQYYAGAAKLKEARQQIEAGEKKLDKKTKQLEESKKKYEDGKAKLEDYEKQLSKIKDYDWTVLSREDNGGVLMMNQFSGLTENLRFSMAALFIIIGLLVSYSSISRIVRDQVVSIGTKKALGLRSREITLSYLAYSGAAVIIGGVLGLAAGSLVIERLLAGPIGSRFIMGAYAPYFSTGEGLILMAIELAMILLTTWLACLSVLKQQAVDLLKGEKPPSAKPRFFEKWELWQRLPLFTKTVINNCINDKRRVFGTIIGIAGCTALMVTAILVNDNIQKSFERQYEDVYSYDTVVRYNVNYPDAEGKIADALEKLGTESTPVYTGPYRLLQPDGRRSSVTVTVPYEEESFDNFVKMESFGETAAAEYDDGVWMNAAYSSHLGAEVGDKVEIMDSEGQIHEFTVQGFFKHYLLSNQMIMSREVYSNEFGQEAEANAFLVDSGESGYQKVKETLSGIKAVRMVKDDYKSSENVFNEFSHITRAVIILYLVLSVLMAVIVLYDLYSVFIEEKKRELIVLMINGFSAGDAKKYIYRDTIVLTVIGIILGIVFGVVMGNITIMTLEPDIAYFVKGIDWFACIAGAALSALLAIVLCTAALRKISGFKLSDINKL